MIFWLPLKYDISTEEAEKVQREIARQWVLYGSLFITNAPRGMGITFLDPACRELAANDPNRTGYVNGVPMFWTGEPDPAPSPAREPLDPHLLAQAMHATPWHQHGSYEDDDDTAHDIADAYARLSDNP